MKINNRTGLNFLLASWLALNSFSAFAGKTLKCIDSPNPPNCLVRLVANSSTKDLDDLYKDVMLTGATDLVLAKGSRLSNEAREALQLQAAGLSAYFAASTSKSMKKISDDTLLAAIALIAAAQHDEDPYSDPAFQKLSVKSKNDDAITLLAVQLWLATQPFNHQLMGFHKVFEKLETMKDLKPETLLSLACDAAYFGQDYDLALEIIKRIASTDSATPDMKAQAASILFRVYSLFDEGLQLLRSGGKDAKNYDVKGILTEGGRVKLSHGYDAKAAKLLAEYQFVAGYGTDQFQTIDFLKDRELLGKAGAKDELRYMGDEYLRYADDAARSPLQRENLYAIASDCYMRAGNKELAVITARKGLPFVAAIIDDPARGWGDKFKSASSNMKATLARGAGTDAVIALYRTGEITEALNTGYLTNSDRYENSKVAGEESDPNWAIDEYRSLMEWTLTMDAVHSKDLKFQTRAFDVLLDHCNASDPCRTNSDETHEHLAAIAAAMGDREKMLSQLRIAASIVDNSWYALATTKLIEEWYRDTKLLAEAAKQTSDTPEH